MYCCGFLVFSPSYSCGLLKYGTRYKRALAITQSGASRGTKVSHLANKKLKAIINMCAISAIQHNPEMKRYYEKRVLEGKNKMSTINIIRNKLIARVFAVVKRQTPYVDTMKFAA